MRILVIGAKGQLGSDLLPALDGHEVLAPTHGELDLADSPKLAAYLAHHKPAAVVNTAAFHDVPKCEREPDQAFALNATALRDLGRACREVKARLVHISTDYVFDGTAGRPYTEEDCPAPLMVYGASKLAGEHLCRAEYEDTLVVRTTGLFGRNPCRAKSGHSFVTTMLRLGAEKGEVSVVCDQRCCPTYTVDLARQIATLLETEAPAGLYHAVNPPGISWAELARLTFAQAGMNVAVKDISSEQLAAGLRRPLDSRLSCDKLERLGLSRMRPLEETLADFLHEVR
ncbi:MAG: dTDP-4-dehydrorhamnose reductase [Myxococcota bacterium]|jgi:dTDP-4-dehydrorhamnose reductase|nr:dTDP-4-dehydrorhamnose reductase [Myxococcota bacterium]